MLVTVHMDVFITDSKIYVFGMKGLREQDLGREWRWGRREYDN